MTTPSYHQTPSIWHQHIFQISLEPSWVTFDMFLFDSYNRKIGYMEKTLDKAEDLRIYTDKKKAQELLLLQCIEMDITMLGGRLGRPHGALGKMAYQVYDGPKMVGSFYRKMEVGKDEIQLYDGQNRHLATVGRDPRSGGLGASTYNFYMQGRVVTVITQQKGLNSRTKYIDARYDPQFYLDRRLIVSVGMLI